MRYLTCRDILSIKFLCKKCYKVVFLNQRFTYFEYYAKKLIDCEFFYEKISTFTQNIIINVQDTISKSNWLYLNYLLDQLKSDLMISSCICHLFHCPRSLFAKSDCHLCSRKFISSLISKPKNFDWLFKLDFEYQNLFV